MRQTDETREMRKEVAQVAAVLGVMKSVLETVREFGRIPESAVFLVVQSRGIGLGGYERMRETLIRTGLVRTEHHQFVWVGSPELNN